ncbi:MFS transporter [Phycicoccus sp. BSK3Z-2]|uniref:MFS transporter n=1 Tax=Phycicoccus avicenniae TaxID=2828860 RepID=A0A941HYI3_9MICO|nr:MFS transporter [Phycicoccus avicenniae]MBR7741877.1 MFS transporter [Phycicoccus avicenniae]
MPSTGPTPTSAVASDPLSAPRRVVAPFVLVAAITMTFLAASSAPTPLYATYQESLSLAPVSVTVIFAAYALALLGALLVAGRLSDFIGRKPVILAAIAVEMIAMVMFAVADSAPELTAARIVQGLATGAATSATAAALADLIPHRSALVASVSPVVGMAAGALGSGVLVVEAPAPEQTVYIVLTIAFGLLAMAASMMRETAPRRPGALGSLRPRMAAPTMARRPLLTAAPVLVAVWSLGGFYLSLGPRLANEITGTSSPLMGADLVSTLTLSGAAAILVLRAHSPARVFAIGAASLVAGLSVSLVGVGIDMATLLFGGALIAGIGFGAGFQGSMRIVMPSASPEERAGLLSTFYVISYLSMGVPAVLAGLLAGAGGIKLAAMTVGGVLIALSAGALVGVARGGRDADERAAHLASADDVRRHSARTAFPLPEERHEQIADTVNHIDSVTTVLRTIPLHETPPASSFRPNGTNR